MKKPFVSILIPSYNSENYIERCLKSAADQTIDPNDFEVIIVNDGSTDNSLKIIEKIAKKYKNIQVYSQKNEGLSITRNRLLGKISPKSEWILWIDADDYIDLKFIESFYVFVNDPSNVKFNLVKCNWIMGDEHKKQVFGRLKYTFDDRIMARIIKTELFKGYKFPAKHRFCVEDWDFWIYKFDEIHVSNFYHPNFNYYYSYVENSITHRKTIFRSRLTHAIEVMSDPILRRIVLDHKIIEHMYSELYIMAKIWFKDLLPATKKIKYKTREPLGLKLFKFIIMLGFLNWIPRRMYKVKN